MDDRLLHQIVVPGRVSTHPLNNSRQMLLRRWFLKKHKQARRNCPSDQLVRVLRYDYRLFDYEHFWSGWVHFPHTFCLHAQPCLSELLERVRPDGCRKRTTDKNASLKTVHLPDSRPRYGGFLSNFHRHVKFRFQSLHAFVDNSCHKMNIDDQSFR